MTILQIAIVAIVAVVGIMVVKPFNKDIALVISIGIGVLILISVCDRLYDVVYTFYDISNQAQVDSKSIECVIKVVGIGYLAEFSNNICIDTGNKNIGEKVLFASRIAILLCVLPILQNLFDVIKNFVQ